ncbi:isochorismatase family cysteine hydrolase [Niveispirillum cyanobacteriorum]|uniref:Isochorismatase n=1 Tax=Niveispirillum cyanobacteriorum TaxID=1612173 RepID=A0A2K9NI41_9PROT|nr:isochorismatase family cysteine hydrolase [Niveispirillum cyanobacteriorum]AUN32750.1 isochorismatase [Niveispirillum cyanobacteriorum]GGE83904.1 isochorismatase [Niveispirillum cyanobacteriorum]
MSATPPIDRARTALLFVDPYNDFLAPEGKLWPMVASVATELGLLNNLRKVVAASRGAGLPVIIVPHHRWKDGDLDGWDHPNPYLLGGYQHKVFETGSWGGDWFVDFAPQPGDLVATEHWGSSGFANTNLDFLLKQKGISRVILIGLIANTCVESTGRFAVELGYHVTLVRDATAAAGPEAMHAAHDINGPTYAHAIVTTAELLAALASPKI